MAFIKQFDRKRLPKTRVELHLHLNGSVRIETLWDLCKTKQIDPGYRSIKEMRENMTRRTPGTLKSYLDTFFPYASCFKGDPAACRRIAYELCEDQALEGVAYFEVMHAPMRYVTADYTAYDFVKAVQLGLEDGERDFGLKARQILSCVHNDDSIAEEVLKLCESFKDHGVVGIDVSKDESQSVVGYTKMEKQIYQRAAQLGIHRTAHAGESGPWTTVRDAIVHLKCERVGHGYRIFDDPTEETYKLALEQNIHFETCPYCSILAGGCALAKKHAIVRFAEDGANFSISKDCTSVTGTTLDEEYAFVLQLGLTEVHLIKANINAARSCFLPEKEKRQLEEQILKHIVP